MPSSALGLVGDIGGTSARFALVRTDHTITTPRAFSSHDYPNIADAIARYLREEDVSAPPSVVLAIAAAIVGDQVTMTNHPWSFSIEQLRRRLGVERLKVVNDFAANALSIPSLAVEDVRQIGGGTPADQAPIGLIGPGTGLGVGALIPVDDRFIQLSSEGGHATMPASDPGESAVLEAMRRRFDHVSAERILSGPGLVNLYNTLCELAGTPAASFTPAQITDPRIGEEDPNARAATEMFCAMLGTVAGNLALTLGARGGIYIAGGIVPKLGVTFERSAFRSRFENKGRFQRYLRDVPTFVILRPEPALLGAASVLRDSS